MDGDKANLAAPGPVTGGFVPDDQGHFLVPLFEAACSAFALGNPVAIDIQYRSDAIKCCHYVLKAFRIDRPLGSRQLRLALIVGGTGAQTQDQLCTFLTEGDIA